MRPCVKRGSAPWNIRRFSSGDPLSLMKQLSFTQSIRPAAMRMPPLEQFSKVTSGNISRSREKTRNTPC